MERIITVADLHCGHRGGLCSPEYWAPPDTQTGQIQRETWGHYDGWIAHYGPPDYLICNGDAIEGKGLRSGGTELVTADRRLQSDIAADCLSRWGARETYLIYGTPYHTGVDEDWEAVIAAQIGADIYCMLLLTVEGVTMHFRHHISASSIPHGRHTAGARSKLWLDQWHLEDPEGWPRAGVVVRSHVHSHSYEGGPGWLAMTTPALCAATTKYGARQCDGVVHFGIVVFDVEDGAVVHWEAPTVLIHTSRPTIVRG